LPMSCFLMVAAKMCWLVRKARNVRATDEHPGI
jgi:hypothetical protein